ncbi:MAG: hypothetical protein OER87_18240 [Gammaproteobacteria bacterium]|nr:hypothetical protein [Gammaproteobacteria bacterium]
MSYVRLDPFYPLIIGMAFAVDPEMRGAHFISHDLVSLTICRVSAVFWSRVFLRNPAAEGPVQS